jgi:ABC-type multidrug transport system fused ATPase/permease subunit
VPAEWRGLYYMYVFIMTGATVAQCFCYSNSNLRGNRVGTHIRTAITVAVYRKSLHQALCARGETTTGKLVNLIASDATRVMWCIPWLHFLPTGLFQLFGAIVFLYSLLGPSIIAGLCVTLLTTPLMGWLVRKNNEYNRVVLLRRDTRVSRVSELISAIKLVKANAWEDGFIKRVTDARAQELHGLFRYYIYMLMSGVMWEGGVPMTAAATFITYAYLGNTITPTVAFTALSLFDVMVEPCQDMAWIFSQFVVALTSFNRVGSFLDSQELDESAIKKLPPDVMGKHAALTIVNGGFGWGTPPQPDPDLKQIKAAVKALDKVRVSITTRFRTWNLIVYVCQAFEAGAITEKRHENAKAFLLGGVVPGAGENKVAQRYHLSSFFFCCGSVSVSWANQCYFVCGIVTLGLALPTAALLSAISHDSDSASNVVTGLCTI